MKMPGHRSAFGAAAILFAFAAVTVAAEFKPTHLPPPDAALINRLRHLTLDDAIEISLRRSPQILTQLQEIQRSQGVYVTVRAQAIPQLILAGTYNQVDPALNGASSTSSNLTIPPLRTVDPATGLDSGSVNLSPLFSSLGSESEASKNYQVTLEIQQQLYNAAIPPSIRQARFLRDAQYYQLRETVDITVNNVKNQFYTVLLDKALITIQEESVRLLQSQLKDQQNRLAAGTVPRFDVLQAEVAVANQQPQLITARNNYDTAFIQLARFLGVEYGPEQKRTNLIQCIGNLDYHPQNFSADAGVASAKANRGLLKQQRQNILAQVQAIEIAAAGYQPVLIGQGGGEIRNDALSQNIGEVLRGWFFGGSLNWNIFDGLATYGRVKQARAAFVEAKIAYDDDVDSVVQDVESNYLSLQQAKELIASQVLNVGEAEEAVRLAQARLSAGAGTQLDVLQSQVALTQAQTTELQARFQYATTLANYERVTGTSTVYDENFDDPLTHPLRHGSTTTTYTGKSALAPSGPGADISAGQSAKVKTPYTVRVGSGKPKPAREKINAADPDHPRREATN